MFSYSKVSQPKRLNHYSRWQYLAILIPLVLLTLSALPNLFPNTTQLQLSPRLMDSSLESAQTLNQFLTQQQISVKKINQQDDKQLIVLANEQQLGQAQQTLAKRYGRSISIEQVEMNNQSAWLNKMGLEPLKLGLDLNGGVLFVLRIDTETAFAERLSKIKQIIRSELRENKIRQVRVAIQKGRIISISGPNVTSNRQQLMQIIDSLRGQFPAINTEFGDADIQLNFGPKARKQFHSQMMQQALTTLRGRIEQLGITEAVTQRQGSNKIRVELPGFKDIKKARRVIGATASLKFYQTQQTGGRVLQTKTGETVRVNPVPVFTGDNIQNARAGQDEMGLPLVNLTLDSVGGNKMLRFSAKNIGRPMVTVYSEYQINEQGKIEHKDKVISVATIQAQLGSRFSITHLQSPQAAQELALLLRAGSLEAPIVIEKQKTTSATLGSQHISEGFKALALGLSITFLFMAIWYRKLGLVANTALLANLMCLLGLMSLLPGAVLTLPGIAGLVLTVGMAVDTNVLIFERIRDEQKRGRSLALAIDRGYQNAFASISDANITTLVTALILYGIGYGPVKGFAVTLGLGVLTSLFSGVLVSRALTNLFVAPKTKANTQTGQQKLRNKKSITTIKNEAQGAQS